MAIADIATTEPSKADKGPDCTVCLALAELPAAEAQALRSLLADRRRRYTEIASRIASDPDTPAWVRDIQHRTYARHATGGCAARERLR